ncbi:MAG: sugar phosphate nucleotidyltransferase [Methanoregula sp.]|nr:sugar phosphate nucleotidyltransferase [Methanoregula sp.]MDD5023491.1 sugar phosphate nucleotidyltransferase [Methanoregula sp.]MDD5186593.1 sugar phosphate nucleotidyltransferase [Methanoregula sp.]
MQAVILAAGEGRRVRPLTLSRPKAMIPVANRPIIGYVIDALVKNGIRDIVVVVGYRREQVIRFLNEFDLPIKVVVQEKQLGTAHALRQAEPEISGDFIVLPGDNYIDAASVASIRKYRAGILVKEHPNPSNFGVVHLKDGYVESIVEKPEANTGCTVSTGIYSLKKDFFSIINSNNTMTEAIAAMLHANQQLQAVPADDWQDAIYPWDLLKMNARLLKRLTAVREGITSRQTTIQGAVRIGRGSVIGPNTVIMGPVVIGCNTTISPNCCILPYTSIGSRVNIEPFTCIGNAIIMDDTTIGSHSRIIDTVIAERCQIGDHTSTCTTEGVLTIEGVPSRAGFGAILGERVRSSPGTIFRNCIVGNNATIEGDHDLVTRIIDDNALVI